jgi:ribosome-associated protein
MRDCLLREIQYRTSRSSGPGGQHVNKTETRVELLWDPGNSVCLNDQQKSLVVVRLASRLTDGGIMIMASERYRSQVRNKEDVTDRFLDLVKTCLVPIPKRVKTKPTRASRERRIKEKKIRGDVKRMRRDKPGE